MVYRSMVLHVLTNFYLKMCMAYHKNKIIERIVKMEA